MAEFKIYHDFTHCNHNIPYNIINLKKTQAIYISNFKEKNDPNLAKKGHFF